MKRKVNSEKDLLRLNAEMYLENKTSGKDNQQSESDTLKLNHELAVHQVELELQNEELKEARIAAQDVSDRYTELYDFAPLGYFTLSTEGKIIEANICGSQMLGKDRSILKANLFSNFISIQTIPIFYSFLKQIFDNKTKKTCELSLSNETGIQTDVQLTGIISGNGNHCLVIALDISDHKQSEEKIKLSEIRYRRLFESAKDGILILEAGTGRIKDVNPFLIDLLGYSKESFIDKEVWELGFFKDIAANKDKFLELQQKRYVRYENLPLETFGGQMINVEFVSNIYFEGKNEVIQCNIRDITARKKVEDALKKSEEKFRFISENITDVIWIYNFTRERISYISPSVFYLIGYTQTELISQELTGLLPKESIQRLTKDLPLRISDFLNGVRSTYVDQFQFECKNGVIKWIESVTQYQFAKNGTIEVQVVSRDISMRKQVEEEIQFKNKELLRINSEKDKFFSIIAHDLRGPFCTFLGLTELMAEGFQTISTEEIQQISVQMRNSAANLFRLLENLLEWSRLQRGLAIFKPKTFLIMSKIAEILTLVLIDANKKNITVHYNISKNTSVYADENMFEVIIRNLVSNAVKFTPVGGNITVSATSLSDKSVSISIKDTGIGMNNKLIDNLFRLDVVTSRKGTDGENSSGLGLILCKDFVEKHGGELWIESAEMKGSTFHFSLPGNVDSLKAPSGLKH